MTRLLLALALIGPVGQLDGSVRDAVQRWRSPGADRIMQQVSDAGRPVTVLATLVAIAIVDRAAGPATAVRALLALAPTNLLVEGLKRAVNRTRPDGEANPSNSSFPSSHAANAFALAAVFGRRWRRFALPFGAAALTVAASRMYLDRHYLSDAVAGAAIGLLCAWAVARWTRRWPARPGARPPGAALHA